jgi:hypothetical protein
MSNLVETLVKSNRVAEKSSVPGVRCAIPLFSHKVDTNRPQVGLKMDCKVIFHVLSFRG